MTRPTPNGVPQPAAGITPAAAKAVVRPPNHKTIAVPRPNVVTK